MTTPAAVKAILDSAGGTLSGKTRFQKSAYFLEAANVGFGFDFSYHHYGPYSEDLAIATDDANALGLINTAWQPTKAGFQYAVYESNHGVEQADDHSSERRREILSILNRYDSIVLELAATAHYLKHNGFADNEWDETRRRKTAKAIPQRLNSAKQLLGELNL